MMNGPLHRELLASQLYQLDGAIKLLGETNPAAVELKKEA
jgi:hypothetical protein